MKKTLFTIILLSLAYFVNAQGSYDIKISIKNDTVGEYYLGFYQFDKTYIADTCANVKNGNINFKGNKTLDKGMYLLINRNKNLIFDFLIDEKEQNVEISTDANDIAANLNSPNSKMNSEFFSYVKFFTSKSQKFAKFAEESKKMSKKDSVSFMREKRKMFEKEANEFEESYLEKNKGSFEYDIINLKKEKMLKEIPKAPNGRPDSLAVYKYYKAHYWDGVNFKDDGMMRNPFFADRVKNYFTQIIVQHPDTVCVEIDRMMNKTVPKSKMNGVLLSNFVSTYENYKLMGFDKVFVYLVDNYFKTGKAKDVYEEKTIEDAIKRVAILKPLQLGNTAPNMFMIDEVGFKKIEHMGLDKATSSEEVTKIYNTGNNAQIIRGALTSMYDVKADYLLLVFWDIDCSHCKEEIPKIVEQYKKLKAEGIPVKVYAVQVGFKFEESMKFLREKGMTDWICVYDGGYQNNLKEKYDIYSTPVLYLVDRNKKIKAKRFASDQLIDIVHAMREEYKRTDKK